MAGNAPMVADTEVLKLKVHKVIKYMKITRFEDIIAWQRAQDLTLHIYNDFKISKDFGFRDQIQRAAVSIMNNIAEGFERGTNKDFKHFLFIAKSSCAEVRSMLYLALNLNYIHQKQFDHNYDLTIQISRLISGFIKTL